MYSEKNKSEYCASDNAGPSNSNRVIILCFLFFWDLNCKFNFNKANGKIEVPYY
jgi:hypothetical protein